MRLSLALVGLCVAALVSTSCKKSPTTPSAGSTPPVQTTEIVISANAASPRNVEVPVGSRVRFTNNDSRSHNMTSDPHPEHDQCPDINQAGFLKPGESRETGNLVVARTCGFHDHDNPDVAALHGQIVIK
jgi:plastocyanin